MLRQIAENERFVAANATSRFVMMQYFGYLRREPDADGYAFWLNKLNQFNGNLNRRRWSRHSSSLVSTEAASSEDVSVSLWKIRNGLSQIR